MRYASIVGIAKYYIVPGRDIDVVEYDVHAITSELESSGYHVWSQVNASARHEALSILSLAIGLCRRKNDVAVLYLGGHGTAVDQGTDGAVLLSHFSDNFQQFFRETVFHSDVDLLARGGAASQLFVPIFDACRKPAVREPAELATIHVSGHAPHVLFVASCRPNQFAQHNKNGSYFRQGFAQAASPTHDASTIGEVITHTGVEVTRLSRAAQTVNYWRPGHGLPYDGQYYPFSSPIVVCPSDAAPASVAVNSTATLNARFPYVDLVVAIANNQKIVGRLCVDIDYVSRRWLDTFLKNVIELLEGRSLTTFVKPSAPVRRRRCLFVTDEHLTRLEALARGGGLDVLPIYWVTLWEDPHIEEGSSEQADKNVENLPCGARVYRVSTRGAAYIGGGSKFYNCRRGTPSWMLRQICSVLLPSLIKDMFPAAAKRSSYADRRVVQQIVDGLKLACESTRKLGGKKPFRAPHRFSMPRANEPIEDLLQALAESISAWCMEVNGGNFKKRYRSVFISMRRLKVHLEMCASTVYSAADLAFCLNLIKAFDIAEAEESGLQCLRVVYRRVQSRMIAAKESWGDGIASIN